MKIRLLAVGSRMESWVQAGYDAYRERLPPFLRPELVEVPLAIRSGRGDRALAVAKEGERLLHGLRPGDYVVALDERGRQYSSVDLAQRLDRWLAAGHSALAFVIGGPEGLAEPVRSRADELWSLGMLTWPHGLVRLMLAEQLYRAWTIRQGHPYHKV